MLYDEESYVEWLENDFMRSMEFAYEDYVEDEGDN